MIVTPRAVAPELDVQIQSVFASESRHGCR
jgi:hypothetical protein